VGSVLSDNSYENQREDFDLCWRTDNPATGWTGVVEFSGTSDLDSWTSLYWEVNSKMSASVTSCTMQLYDYNAGAYPSSGDGYIIHSSWDGTQYSHNQTISTNPTYFRDGSGNWKVKVTTVSSSYSWEQFDLIEIFRTLATMSYAVDLSCATKVAASVLPQWTATAIFSVPIEFSASVLTQWDAILDLSLPLSISAILDLEYIPKPSVMYVVDLLVPMNFSAAADIYQGIRYIADLSLSMNVSVAVNLLQGLWEIVEVITSEEAGFYAIITGTLVAVIVAPISIFLVKRRKTLSYDSEEDF
jgi:hypothetical protein